MSFWERSSLSVRIAFLILVLTIIWSVWFIGGVNYPVPIQTVGNVAVYNQLPSGFPAGLWINNDAPQHVDVVKNSDGTTETTVVYSSQGSLLNAMSAIEKNLQNGGWTIGQNQLSGSSGFLSASQGSQTMIVTLVTVSGNMQATFQLTR